MAVWSKAMYVPETGVWHEIVNASGDTKMSYCQIVNLSAIEQARVIVAINQSGDTQILAPAGLSIQETGAIGTTVYEYKVTAVKPDGRETDATSSLTILTGADLLSTSNYHTLTWDASSGATKYRLYCRIGGTSSVIIKVAETTQLTYSNKGAMQSSNKWPWVNMTGVQALLTWCELSPGVGIEPTSRPLPLATGDNVSIYTTGAISLFASGEV